MNFDHLVLLMGTSPLPNYVAAQYFRRHVADLQKIWIVHTIDNGNQRGTYQLAQRLKEILEAEFKGQIKMVPLADAGLAIEIEDNLKNYLLQHLNYDDKVHLNYTGGTKVMAVHVYRVLSKKYPDLEASYLDSRQFCMKNDSCGAISNDLRTEIGINFSDLVKLHNYEYVPKNNDYSKILPRLRQILFSQTGRLEKFAEWANKELRPLYFYNKNEQNEFVKTSNKFCKINDLDNDEKITAFKSKAKEFPGFIKEIIQAFPSNRSILDEQGLLWVPDRKDKPETIKQRMKYSVKDFLAGPWLEYYVAAVLREGAAADSLPFNIKESFKLENIGTKKQVSEVDGILMYGYQACAISCTTDSTIHLCKAKGFEALHWSRQLGGEETKAILVTFLSGDKVRELKETIDELSGSSASRLLVLGIEDLVEEILWSKVKKHIKADD